MAGERFQLPGYIELSAICVHPNGRGQGLGAALTLHWPCGAGTR
jgi:ribosomal protein S18 acetylase RimI-like enzyme